jgi:hypothetical protein
MTDVLAPVLKTRELPCTPDAAFALFTDRMGEWWPTAAFSVAGDRVRSVTVEPLAGGHVYETDDAGTRNDWATVIVHEAPHRLVLDWYPGQSPDQATRVEATFTATDTGCTLRLEHGGWPAGDDERRKSYDTGWDMVLAPLVSLAGA